MSKKLRLAFLFCAVLAPTLAMPTVQADGTCLNTCSLDCSPCGGLVLYCEGGHPVCQCYEC